MTASFFMRCLVAVAGASAALGASLRQETLLKVNELPATGLPQLAVSSGRRLDIANSPLTNAHTSNPDQDAKWWLLAHNQLRCYHGLAKFEWHTGAAKEIQDYVDWMAANNVFKHWSQAGRPAQGAPVSGVRGENLISYTPPIERHIQQYYDEIRLCADLPGCEVSNVDTKSWYEVGHLRAILSPVINRVACACSNKYCGCRYGIEGPRQTWDSKLNAVQPDLVVQCDTEYKRLYEQAGNAYAWTPFQYIPHFRDTYDATKVLALPEPEKRTFPGCKDAPGYRDDEGRTCADHYAKYNVCPTEGDKWQHMGKPNDNCCACAYKLAPTSSPTRSPTPATQCEDNASWYFGGSATFDCTWISVSEERCSTYGDWRGQEGQTGNEACCKCKWLAEGMAWEDAVAKYKANKRADNSDVDTQCTDTAGWSMKAGASYDCAWITSQESYCATYGGWDGNGSNGPANQECCKCKWLAQGRTWSEVLELANGGSGGGSSSETGASACTDDASFYYFSAGFDCAWFATAAATTCTTYGDFEWPAGNGKANDKCCACKNLQS